MSTDWYLQDVRYFSGYENSEISEAFGSFDEFLAQSPETYKVFINDKLVEKTIIIQSESDYNKRRILFKKDDVLWGDLITHDNEKWLVTERPFFNKIHSKSKMALCTNVLSFEVDGEREIVGWTDFNQPIYSDEPNIVTIEFPCVVEDASDLKSNNEEEVNLPNGDMALIISYTDSEQITEDREFSMFNQTYRISGIDKSKTKDSLGVLKLVVKRVQSN
ncbi:hypothetical protein [Paraliobacillus ryukyuensis]|uniref:hypothetical protein n=1 Tax=Paraliobacillus ryukyuensis TaxID=200904 RepID=UPI0009A73220|nr:hypothetical protein [Paraliobacillus ryukyuensis]